MQHFSVLFSEASWPARFPAPTHLAQMNGSLSCCSRAWWQSFESGVIHIIQQRSLIGGLWSGSATRRCPIPTHTYDKLLWIITFERSGSYFNCHSFSSLYGIGLAAPGNPQTNWRRCKSSPVTLPSQSNQQVWTSKLFFIKLETRGTLMQILL